MSEHSDIHRRFIPPSAAPYLIVGAGGTAEPVAAGLRTAGAELLRAYGSGTRLFAAAGAWLAGIIASIGAPLGLILIIDGTRTNAGLSILAGAGIALVGAGAAVAAWRVGADVVRAGAALSKSMSGWTDLGPRRTLSRGQGAGTLLVPLLPETYLRLGGGALTALLAVLGACLLGYLPVWANDGADRADVVLVAALTAMTALWTAVNAFVAVASLRGVFRVNRARVRARL